MEISKKRIAALTILPIAVLLLSGCGQQTKAPGSASTPVATQESAPTTVTPAPQQPQDPTASAPAPLPPLPADDKQAIDSELKGIDQDLKTTDNTIKSTDLSNTSLGL